MLERAAEQPRSRDLDLPAVAVLGDDPDLLAAGDVGDVARDREAALEVAVVAVGADDLRVDQLVERVPDLDHAGLQRLAELGRGEADAGRVAHRVRSGRRAARAGTCRSCRRAGPSAAGAGHRGGRWVGRSWPRSISKRPAAPGTGRQAVGVASSTSRGRRPSRPCPRPRRPHRRPPSRASLGGIARGIRRRARRTPRRSLGPALDFSASFPLASAVASPALRASGTGLRRRRRGRAPRPSRRRLAHGRRRLLGEVVERVTDRLELGIRSTRPRTRRSRRPRSGGVIGRPWRPRRRRARRRTAAWIVGIGHGGVLLLVASLSHERRHRSCLPEVARPVALRAATRGRRRPTTAAPAPPSSSATGSVAAQDHVAAPAVRAPGDVGGRRPDDRRRRCPRSRRASAEPLGHRRGLALGGRRGRRARPSASRAARTAASRTGGAARARRRRTRPRRRSPTARSPDGRAGRSG